MFLRQRPQGAVREGAELVEVADERKPPGGGDMAGLLGSCPEQEQDGGEGDEGEEGEREGVEV